MSFLDLMSLLKHYWRILLISAVVCALALPLVYFVLVPTKYEATSGISVVDPSGTVPSSELMATVGSLAPRVETAVGQNGVSITGKASGAGSTRFVFSAVSQDPEASVAAANTAAQQVVEESKAIYDALQEDTEQKLSNYEQNGGLVEELGGKPLDIITRLMTSRNYAFCNFNVQEASEAVAVGPSALKLGLAAGLAGLFLGVCVVAILDFVKRPIRGKRDVEDSFPYPLLGASRDTGDDLLWANVQFAAGERPGVLCVLGACMADVPSLCDRLGEAIRRSGAAVAIEQIESRADLANIPVREKEMTLLSCPSLGTDAAALWAAHEADATIVCIRQWKDTHSQLSSLIKELDLAQAKVTGIVLQ